MRTRTLIGLYTTAAVVLAGYQRDLGAVYIALGVGGLIYHLHAIEVKINRLLDHYGITVWDSDIAKD